MNHQYPYQKDPSDPLQGAGMQEGVSPQQAPYPLQNQYPYPSAPPYANIPASPYMVSQQANIAPQFIPMVSAQRPLPPRILCARQDVGRTMLIPVFMTLLSVFVAMLGMLIFWGISGGIFSQIDQGSMYWLTAISIPLTTLSAGVIYLIMERPKLSDLVRFSHKNALFSIFGIFAGLAICLLANIPANAVKDLLKQVGYQSSDLVSANFYHPQSWVLAFAITILAPIMEEFVFRGIICAVLEKYGKWFAVLLSGLVFGLAHGDIVTVVFATIAGFVFGFLYLKTRNLWVPIAVHWLNNSIAMFGEFSDDLFEPSTAKLLDALMFWIPIILGMVCLLFLLLFRRKAFFTLNKDPEDYYVLQTPGKWYFGHFIPNSELKLKSGEGIRTVLRSVSFWIVVLTMVLTTLQQFFPNWLSVLQ